MCPGEENHSQSVEAMLGGVPRNCAYIILIFNGWPSSERGFYLFVTHFVETGVPNNRFQLGRKLKLLAFVRS